jgi:D-sedoheptulose 7-phosphate isomerase
MTATDAGLQAELAAVRARGGRIVTTNGCFDLLHPGHVRFLAQARAFGDFLVVGLNSDASVRALKGPTRPVVPVAERAAMLLALRDVDRVVVFEELVPLAFLDAVRPDVHCKGADYAADALPEAELVRNNGGRIEILPLYGGFSTTRILRDRGLAGPGVSAAEDAVVADLLRASHVVRDVAGALAGAIVAEARRMTDVMTSGGRILVCGNGGSAADAQHLAAELVGRFGGERGPLPAVSLAADAAVLTALANDYGFERVFARQVQALGRPGDLLLVISASGRSPNILAAVDAATTLGLRTTALTGEGSDLAARVEHALIVPAAETALVQQGHRAVLHALCAVLDGHAAR